jgi:anti-anti-sigma factor
MPGSMDSTTTFSVAEDVHEGCIRLRPSGDLDLATEPVIRRRLAELHEDQIGTVLDLGDVSFMGSEGIHLLADAQIAASRDGWRFSARNPSPQAQLILRACDMRALVGT